MINDYETFEIEVGAKTPDGYPIRVKSPDGDARGLLRIGADDFALGEALAAIERRDVDAEYLVQLGDYLFAELLNDASLLERYRTSLGTVRGQGKGLRVRLSFDDPGLAAYPWEFLHDPEEDGFLAIAAQTALVRYVPMRGPVRPLAMSLPLRVLVAIAAPSDLDALDVRRERRLIEDALAEQQAQRNIQLLVVERATTAKINDAMKTFRPHVFHFIGHGVYADEQVYLALEDDEGTARLISEREFSEIFASVNETRLAVLNACQSANTSSTVPLVGLAPKLLQRQLSAVVAMQQPFTDQAALVFSRSFYRSLALGAPVDGAVSVARGDIYTELGSDQIDWAIPVLFLRAQDGRLFRVEENRVQATQSLEIPPPPEPQSIPPQRGFVGREEIVARCEASLAEFGSVAITGMTGIGKSAVGAHLAQRYTDRYKIFWHPCAAGEGIEMIFWKLAAFMAWHGNAGLWTTLQSALLTGSPPPPSNLLADYVIQNLQYQEYLLCLDDYHHLEASGHADPALSQFIARLRPLVFDGKLSIIVVSDQIPTFHTVTAPVILTGLAETECLALLEANGLRVEAGIASQLIAHTEGNPQLLLLAAQVVQRSPNPQRVLARLGTAPSILDYIVRELDNQLSQDEREKMRGAAILLDQAGTRWVIEAITQSTDSLPALLQLTNRHLLETLEGKFEWEYHQHRVLQTIYYYGLLAPPQRREMHLRAAAYYRLDEVDDYKAALHFFNAGDHLRAAQILTGDIWSIINLGYREPAIVLLDGLAAQNLPSPQWERVRIAQGKINSYLRRTDVAQRAFAEALSSLEGMIDLAEAAELVGYACWGMADLLQYDAPQEALGWVERGLARQAESSASILHADLLVKLGTVYSALGNFSDALEAIERGLALLGNRHHLLRVGAYENRGVCYYQLGDLSAAVASWQQGIQTGRRLRNLVREPSLRLNLAVAYMTLGEWPQASESYAEAAELSRQWGNLNIQTLVHLNSGILYTKQGQQALAESHLTSALELARQHGLDEWEGHALFSLADLRLRQQRLDEAGALLAAAEGLIADSQHDYQKPELLRLQALTSLAAGDLAQARSQAEESIAAAQTFGMEMDTGVGQRVLGQVLAAGGQMADAVAAFQKSLELLKGKDAYALACTQMELAQTLESVIASGEAKILDTIPDPQSYAADLSSQASAMFERLQIVH
ncbi:MAG: CHAT domain-containing protein [Chloroflexi bacterium]|nr:MAG: CHAT domain-containing protein [Chloroflexota bacterium]